MTQLIDALKALAGEITEQVEADRARARQLEAQLAHLADRIAAAAEAKASLAQLLAALAPDVPDLPITYSQNPKSAQIVISAGALAAAGHAALTKTSDPAPGEQTSPQVVAVQDAGDPTGLAAPQSDAPAAGANPTRAPAAPKTGSWTAQEDARLLQLKRDGKTNPQVAELLGRRPRAIDNRLARLRKSKAAPAAAPDAAPIAAAPLQGRKARAQRVACLRLEVLGWSGGWTPQLDLALVEGLTRGEKLRDVAEAIGMGREDARVRFAALVPEPSMEAQAAMIAALKEICEAAND